MSEFNVYAKVNDGGNESAVNGVDALVEEYGFTSEQGVDTSQNELLEFDTLEAFEEFLSEEKQTLEKSELSFVEVDSPISTFDDGPYYLTYKFVSSSIFEKITGYARVKRDATGYIMNVDVWSEQTGLVTVIEWIENHTSYITNNNNRNGKATIDGVRHYHVSVAGIPIGFKKSTTLEIPF